MLWTHKYSPKKTSEIPQPSSERVKQYVLEYKKQKKKALFIHGPPGTGKTTYVLTLAKELGAELVEVNASDFRTTDAINQKIGNAISQMSLFGNNKIILVDEIDGIAGREDRGGIQALVKLLPKSAFPIILTANDPWNKKFSALRSKTELVEFPSVRVAEIATVINKMLEQEKVSVDEALVKTVARRSGGDLRGAIIDANVLAGSGTFTREGVDELSPREQSETIANALIKILKTTDPKIALDALDTASEDINECILWIEENMPKEYTKTEDLSRGFDSLSKADVFRGRIRKQQYWRLLSYVASLSTAGVAVAKDGKNPQVIPYKRTRRILKIWMAKQKYAKRNSITSKIAEATHCSSKKALQEHFPIVQKLIRGGDVGLIEELDLNEEEVAWLVK